MADAPDALEQIGGALLDGYILVDEERQVTAFNRPYYAMLPRAQARKLKGSRCCQLLSLAVCEGGGCLAEQCIADGTPVRYDEIEARIDGTEGPEGQRRVIVSAAPIQARDGGQAALIMLRDVSDAADVQRKYKDMLDAETREKERLEDQIVRKTKELMDANQELNRVQSELMQYKKGLFG
jgi:transcriptional regulator with PAS, ATPase and Fis domain